MAKVRSPEKRLRDAAIDQAAAHMAMAKDQLKAGKFTEGKESIQKALTVINGLPAGLFDKKETPTEADASPVRGVGVGT